MYCRAFKANPTTIMPAVVVVRTPQILVNQVYEITKECKLRVLNTYKTYFPDPPGGLQEAIRHICYATSRYGIDNTIFTLSPHPQPVRLERPEAVVERSRSWGAPASCDLGAFNAFSTFSRLAAVSDVVHYYYPWPFGDVLHAAIRPDAPAVLTYISDIVRQAWLGKAYEPLMWRTLRSMKVIVANSPAYAVTSPVLTHPSIRDKVRVIPLGIVEDCYPQEADPQIFDRLGLAEDEPYFLFIGVHRYYKGLHTLVKAAKNVKAKIVIAGSGPESKKIRDLVRIEDADNVLFAGQISDAEKVSLLKSCLALVLPSHLRSEAYGMVLVEAAMFGKPQISCEIGTGTSFVNKHEESGIVILPERPDILCDAMNQLLRDRQLAEGFGEGARSRYERLFSGAALGQAYAELYRDVANG